MKTANFTQRPCFKGLLLAHAMEKVEWNVNQNGLDHSLKICVLLCLNEQMQNLIVTEAVGNECCKSCSKWRWAIIGCVQLVTTL